MHHTKLGTNVRNIQGNEWVSYGQRVGNMTVNKYYRIEYPKDIQLLMENLSDYAGFDGFYGEFHRVYTLNTSYSKKIFTGVRLS